MIRGWVFLCSVLLLFVWSRSAEAFPWMIRHAQTNCSTCHADPSGGELLTVYGRLQGKDLLSMQYRDPSLDDASLEAPRIGPLWNSVALPSWLLLGAAYRHSIITKLGAVNKTVAPPLQADVFGQVMLGPFRAAASLGVARVPAGSPHARPAQLTWGQGLDWNLLSRWHWLGLAIGANTMLRMGRLNVPFGLRIPEHIAWVRDMTRTDYESDQQDGLSIFYASGAIRAEAMAILGNYQINPDAFRERGYSALLEGTLAPTATLGVSSKVTRAEKDFVTLEEATTLRQSQGVFARWSPAVPVVFLGELDLLLRSRRDAGYAGFAQVDLEPLQGLHFMLTGEVLDEGYTIRQADGSPSTAARSPGAGKPKLGGWLSSSWFFWNQCELRLDTTIRYNDPFLLMGQFHVYL